MTRPRMSASDVRVTGLYVLRIVLSSVRVSKYSPRIPLLITTSRSTATAKCVLPIPGGPIRSNPFSTTGNASANSRAFFTARSSCSLG